LDLLNKFQRKDAFLGKKSHKNPKVNLEHRLLYLFLGRYI
jgi:hypothetical protein